MVEAADHYPECSGLTVESGVLKGVQHLVYVQIELMVFVVYLVQGDRETYLLPDGHDPAVGLRPVRCVEVPPRMA